MANAALAGGVGIGSVCDVVSPTGAFGIGLLSGAISVIGYVFLLPLLERRFNLVDTCGVHNLHGLPGLLGGFSALLVVPGIATVQLTGIGITLGIALTGGLVAGVIIRITGTTREPYEDSVEFTHVVGPESERVSDQLLERMALLENKLAVLATQQHMSKTPEPGNRVADLELQIEKLESEIRKAQSESGQLQPKA
jgi:ammonium transporter Rh